MDVFRPTKLAPPRGTLVVKTSGGPGAPRNGTMGHTYVADAETGVFYGLVLTNSLVPAGKATAR